MTADPVKRYDCTSGGAQFCQGCYTMEEAELGDYVRWEDYERLDADAANERAEKESLRDQVERLTTELAQWQGIAAMRNATMATLAQERDAAIRVLAIALACDNDEQRAEWMAEAIVIVSGRD